MFWLILIGIVVIIVAIVIVARDEYVKNIKFQKLTGFEERVFHETLKEFGITKELRHKAGIEYKDCIKNSPYAVDFAVKSGFSVATDNDQKSWNKVMKLYAKNIKNLNS
jgi:hypothetical protein